MKQGQDGTKLDSGKSSCCLETLLCLPHPAAWRAKLVAASFPGSYKKQWLQLRNAWSRLWLWKMLFPSLFNVLVTVLKASLVFQRSTRFLFSFSDFSFCGKSGPSWGSKNSFLPTWLARVFWFLLASCLELVFHTSMSQVLPQLFKNFLQI